MAISVAELQIKVSETGVSQAAKHLNDLSTATTSTASKMTAAGKSVASFSAAVGAIPKSAHVDIKADAGGALRAANEVAGAVGGIPTEHNTALTGDGASVLSAAEAAEGAVGAVPTEHDTAMTGDAAGVLSAANAAEGAIGAVPTEHNTAILGEAGGLLAAAAQAEGSIGAIPTEHATAITGEASGLLAAAQSAEGSIGAIPTEHSTAIVGDAASVLSAAQSAEGAIGAIPTEHNTAITGEAGSVLAAAQSVEGALGSIPNEKHITITADASGALAGIGQVNTALQSLATSGGSASSVLSSTVSGLAGMGPAGAAGAAGIAALAGGLSFAVSQAADFQQSLKNTQAATGATTAEMALMRAEALKIGADTSKSASEAAAAMGELTKAGVSVKDAVGGVARTVVQLSEATGAGVSEMAVLVSNAMNTFGLGAQEAAAAADLIAKSTSASAIGVNDYAFSLAAVGPVAKLAGMDLSDLSTAIGILGNNALRGSDAGTSLKTMLMSLAAPSKEAKALMAELGIALYDSTGKTLPFRDVLVQLQGALSGVSEQQQAVALKILFGSDAIRAGTILLKEGTAGWDSFKTAMAGAPGVAEQSAARLDTLNGSIEQFKGSVETLAIAIGTHLIPALTQGVENATAFINALGSLPTDEIALFFDVFASRMPLIAQFSDAMSLIGAATGLFTDKTVEATAAVLSEDQALAQATQSSLQMAGAQDEINAAQQTAAATTQEFTKWLAGARQEMSQLAAATQPAAASADMLAQMFGKTAKELEKGVNWTKEFANGLKELSGAATPATQAADLLGKALDVVKVSAEGISVTKAPETLKLLGDRAREALSAADLAPAAKEKIGGLLDKIEQGGPGAKQALADLKKALEEAKAPVDALAASDQSMLKWQESMSNAATGITQSLDSLLDGMKDFTNRFLIAMGEVPVGAEAAMERTKNAVNIDLSAPGAATALSYVGAFKGQIITIENAGSEAGQALLRSWGLIVEPAKQIGVSTATGYATGIGSTKQQAEAAANGVAAAAMQGLKMGASKDGAHSLGFYFGQGFALGISGTAAMAAEAARLVGIGANIALKEAIGAQSPAKEGIAAGEYLGEGFAIGIENGIPGVTAAATNLGNATIAPVRTVFRTFEGITADGLKRFGVALTDFGIEATGGWEALWERFPQIAHGGMFATVEEANGFISAMTSVMASGTSSWAAYGAAITAAAAPARQMAKDIAGIETEIAMLNVALTRVDGHSAQAQAIKKQIEFLEGWKKQLTATQAAQAALAKAMELSLTAFDGFNRAWAKFGQQSNLVAQFGDLGAKAITALRTALVDGSAAAGEAAFSAIQAVVTKAAQSGNAEWNQLGQALLAAYADAIQTGSPQVIASVEAMLAELHETMNAGGRLSAETFWVAFNSADMARTAVDEMGKLGADIVSAFGKAMTEGGAQHIAAAAKLVDDLMVKFRGLPEHLQGSLGTQMHTALQDFLVNPTKEGLDALKPILAQINDAFEAMGRMTPFQKLQSDIRSFAQTGVADLNAIAGALKNMQGALSAGTAEGAAAGLQMSGFGAIEATLKAISASNAPERLQELIGRLDVLGKAAGLPQEVIDKLKGFAQAAADAGNTGASLAEKLATFDARIASLKASVEQYSSAGAGMNDMNKQIVAGLQAAIKEQEAQRAALVASADITQQSTTLLAGRKNEVSANAAADKTFLDVLAQQNQVMAAQLPTFAELSASIQALGAVIGGEAFAGALSTARENIGSLGTATATTAGEVQGAAGIVTGAFEQMGDGVLSSASAFEEWKARTGTTFDGVTSMATTTGAAVPANIAAGVKDGTPKVNAAITSQFNQMSTLGTQAKEGGSFIGFSLVDGIIAGLGSKKNDLTAAMLALLATLPALADKAKADASPVGVGIAAGIIAGAASKAGDVGMAIAKLVTDGIAAGKSAAKIASPSQLSHDEVGVPIGQGVAVGIASMAGAAASATVGVVTGAFSAGLAAMDEGLKSMLAKQAEALEKLKMGGNPKSGQKPWEETYVDSVTGETKLTRAAADAAAVEWARLRAEIAAHFAAGKKQNTDAWAAAWASTSGIKDDDTARILGTNQKMIQGYWQGAQLITQYARGGLIKEPMWLVNQRTGRLHGEMAESGPEMIVPTRPASGGGQPAVGGGNVDTRALIDLLRSIHAELRAARSDPHVTSLRIDGREIARAVDLAQGYVVE